MRVTDNARLLGVLRNNAVSTIRLTNASRRASAGAKVSKPSDDPVAYTTSVRRGSTIANMASRSRTARAAADELNVAQGALDSATELLAQAKSLAVQGANETLSPTDRNALALQVSGIRDQLLDLANTRGSGGYVFAGSRTDTAPFDTAGTFTGNDGVMRVPVSDGVAPRMNVSGAKAFTIAGGTDVFAELTALTTALSTNDLVGIRSSIGTVQKGYDQVVAVQVDSGLSIERLHSAADVIDTASLAIGQARTRDVGADDLAGLATELSAAGNSYSQSLTVTKMLLSLPSLAKA
jgi:flagellar hook-associated protein 3 FlgL